MYKKIKRSYKNLIKLSCKIYSTTILSVRKGGKVVIAGDGQVTFNDTILKTSAKKVRKIYSDKIIAGFAGSAADGLALFTRLEAKLKEFNGNLAKAAVELAREWRTDKVLRRLEALILVVDKNHSYLISGTGDVIEPDDGVIGIGSGGGFAMAAAKALVENTNLDAREIVEKAMKIAASICIYTNDKITIEEL